jgi:hypothetical protein
VSELHRAYLRDLFDDPDGEIHTLVCSRCRKKDGG